MPLGASPSIASMLEEGPRSVAAASAVDIVRTSTDGLSLITGSTARVTIASNGDTTFTGAVTFSGSASFSTFLAGNGTVNAPGFAFTSDPNSGWYWQTSGAWDFSSDASHVLRLGIQAANGAHLNVGNGALVFGATPTAGDLFLLRGAANIVHQRNGANAQNYFVFNTYTDGSNYELGQIGWSGNQFFVGTAHAGTGSARALVLQTGGVGQVTIGASGGMTVTKDGTYNSNTDGALLLKNATTPAKRLVMGFDNSQDVGYIQSVQDGVATKVLNLQPSGGFVLIGDALKFASTESRIVGGATSLALRNNADDANNFIVTDAGAVTIRAGLTVTAGGVTIPAGNLGVGVAQHTGHAIIVQGTPTGGANNTQSGVFVDLTLGSGATSLQTALFGKVTGADAVYTTTAMAGLTIGTNAKGAQQTVAANHGIRVEAQTASTSGEAYGIWVGAVSGGAGANHAAYFTTPTGTGAKTINTDSGAGTPAHLTTGGSWTNASSWAAGKQLLGAVGRDEVGGWLDWLGGEMELERYRYPYHFAGRGRNRKQLSGGHSAADFDSYFPVLDRMPERIREVICSDAGGGISTKDVDGFLMAVVGEAQRRISAIDTRLTALERRAA